jgi:hypothetical protein
MHDAVRNITRKRAVYSFCQVVVVDQKPNESVDPTDATRTEADAPEPPTEATETTHNAIPDADTLKDVDLSSEAGYGLLKNQS